MKVLKKGERIQFVEVLNGTWDYLFLGDPQTLLRFKQRHDLPDDLIGEFTSSDYGDQAVESGAMIPLSGIDNFPYTVFFSADCSPVLLTGDSDLQHHQKGYRLLVQSDHLFLFTVPFLQSFNHESIAKLEVAGQKGHRQMVRLSSGWYQVEVLAGQTRQRGELAPTVEFVLSASDVEPPFTAPVNYAYTVRADQY